MSNTISRDRSRQEEWRAVLPRWTDLVENVAPRLWNEADDEREPADEWRKLVDDLAAEVRAAASDPDAFNADLAPEARFGYAWSSKVNEVGVCIDYLMRVIRADIGVGEGETLASMVLVHSALAHLHMELNDGGTRKGRDDSEEQSIRVYRALLALNYRFDDDGLRRVRALCAFEICAAHTEILDDAEVEASVERMRAHALDHGRPFDPDEEEQQRKWFRVELPMMKAVNSRSTLAHIDPAFASLDPLVVLEELDESRPGAKGGRSDGGEGKTGPARALARLAVQCGALGYSQGEDETFDDAVERVRRNLHTTRSRLRDEMRKFPGLIPPPAKK